MCHWLDPISIQLSDAFPWNKKLKGQIMTLAHAANRLSRADSDSGVCSVSRWGKRKHTKWIFLVFCSQLCAISTKKRLLSLASAQRSIDGEARRGFPPLSAWLTVYWNMAAILKIVGEIISTWRPKRQLTLLLRPFVWLLINLFFGAENGQRDTFSSPFMRSVGHFAGALFHTKVDSVCACVMACFLGKPDSSMPEKNLTYFCHYKQITKNIHYVWTIE